MRDGKGGVARTVGKKTLGGVEYRVVEKGGRFFGLASGKIVAEGDEEVETWRLLLDGGKLPGTRYAGIDDAKRLFLHHYPNGLGSAAFTDRGERGYKWKAKQRLDATVPLEKALDGSDNGEAILSVFYATDLLSPFEKMRIGEALRGPNADRFIQAAAQFALSEDRKGALREMEKALRPHEAAKWTGVTYLPFLWRPDVHMFLKPEATIDFADRTGHRFAGDYAATLDIRIYDSLLDLAATTTTAIADLGPRDNVDIQSFIWVVSGAYEGEAPRP